MSTIAIYALAVAAIGGSRPDRTELQAKAWFNSPSIRVPDDRTYVILFFTTFQDQGVEPLIAKLNKLHRRGDTVVVGLSPESKERVEKFIEKRKVRFTVGARSPTYKEFGIKRFPRVVVLERKRSGNRVENIFVDLESPDSWFPHHLPEDEPLEPGAFDEKSSVEVLKRHAHEDSSYLEQKRAVRLLRDRLTTDEFMGFCDEILEYEYRPALRGAIAYQKHLADPNAPVKEPLLAGSTLARREMRENPDDPQWDRYREYFDGIENRSAEQLFQEYFEHLGDDLVDLQTRKSLPYELVRRLREERVEQPIVVDYLKQMLLAETDFATRQRIVGAFSEVCRPGDFEVADFLEEQLKTEKNIRVVQPMMEYTIRYLRTGEE